MAVSRYLNHIRDIVVALPEYTALGLTKKDIVIRYTPQVKDRLPQDYPAISIAYDYNQRERWAPIDNLNLYLSIEMKVFEQAEDLADAIRNALRDYKYADNCLTIFATFDNGGDGSPIYQEKRNTFEVVLEFETRIKAS